MSKITKKDVVYNFRQNDIKNGGEGAPLAPIFHKLIIRQINDRYYSTQIRKIYK